MDGIMKGTEIVSDYYGLGIIQFGVFLFGKEKELETARLGLVAWGLANLTTLTTKIITNRTRPDNTIRSSWNSSFPSGHTASYFSLATVYANKYPKLSLPLYGFGILVGLSRVYQGEHYPSDVVAGAVLGWICGRLVLKLEKRLIRCLGE